MRPDEPMYDLAHLAHVELRTPKPDETLRFFVDVKGMTVSGQGERPNRVVSYLRHAAGGGAGA